MSKLHKIVAVIILLAFTLIGCSPKEQINNNGLLQVNIIDVGQGDAILIKTPNNKNILIDTGSKKEKDKLYTFLEANSIKNIDILVGTHPHEDHIGNMASVINDFNIGQVYMPKVTHTTKTFKDVMTAIKEKGLKVKAPEIGKKFDIDGIGVEFLAPNSQKYNDLNNYSIVTKLSYGENSFLFTGDAEKESEKEMISKGYDLNADVLKLGHHGSSTSSSKEFVTKVNPKYAVVSCAKNNDYGHPHKETINLLTKMDIKILKTYDSGTVKFTSDGKNINVNTSK